MKLRNGIIKSGFTLLVMLMATASSAATVTNIWAVSNTGQINCGTSPHGLWTNTLNLGADACNDYFSFNTGSTFTEFDDGTAVLAATATNPDGFVADIDITFGSYSPTHSPVKTGGGPELASWYFYESIVSGGITVDSVNYSLAMAGGYALQIGDGANDKTGVFGASVWLLPTGGTYNGGHWDLNMDFSPVPVPAAVWLFGSGLLGLVGVARRKAV
jgi:hypothetical protein